MNEKIGQWDDFWGGVHDISHEKIAARENGVPWVVRGAVFGL